MRVCTSTNIDKVAIFERSSESETSGISNDTWVRTGRISSKVPLLYKVFSVAHRTFFISLRECWGFLRCSPFDDLVTLHNRLHYFGIIGRRTRRKKRLKMKISESENPIWGWCRAIHVFILANNVNQRLREMRRKYKKGGRKRKRKYE